MKLCQLGSMSFRYLLSGVHKALQSLVSVGLRVLRAELAVKGFARPLRGQLGGASLAYPSASRSEPQYDG